MSWCININSKKIEKIFFIMSYHDIEINIDVIDYKYIAKHVVLPEMDWFLNHLNKILVQSTNEDGLVYIYWDRLQIIQLFNQKRVGLKPFAMGGCELG